MALQSSPFFGQKEIQVIASWESFSRRQFRGSASFMTLVFYVCMAACGCGSKSAPPTKGASNEPAPTPSAQTPSPAPSTLEVADADAAAPSHALSLPLTTHWTGDFEELIKHKVIRALVVNSKMEFFYDKGRARGTTAEALQELEAEVNKKLGNPNPRIKIAYIPMPLGELKSALDSGIGDIVATAVVISPERGKFVDFTIPYYTGAKKVVVSNANTPALKSLDDLSGQVVWVNPISVANQPLASLNESLKKAGRPEVTVRASDQNLTEDDLLEMVNAGLIPATVAGNLRSQFWSKVYPNIRVDSDAVVGGEGDLAWAVRKNSPQLKQVLDDFIRSHRLGSAFGNTVLQRYLKNTKWVKDSTSSAEMAKFQTYVEYFRKYAQEYDFDYLMLIAQGYQESMLNQSLRSPRGAVGVMQVLPQYAAAKPIAIPNVQEAEANIHAGVKMMHNIQLNYFNDAGIDTMNKTLFTFAAYNAGPGRITKLRRMATEQGLDPNKWFGNVELMAAKDIGQETVQYVSNIYKYYVAYKMAVSQADIRAKAKESVNKP
jgi:membrane-bound lytic murein transglycosylase MltF